MNILLLSKWWYRFKDPTVIDKRKDIMTTKYSSTGLETTQYSHFWKGILSIRHIVDLGINRVIGNGLDTSFWLDRWYGDCALYCLFPNLFQISSDPLISVSRVIAPISISLPSNRQLTGLALTEWINLNLMLSFQNTFSDTTSPDKLHWRWQALGKFTVHSLYQWLEYGGIKNRSFTSIWKTKIPLKVKIFMWLVKERKFLTKDNLANKGWTGDQKCQFCDELETLYHLFVTCPFISGLWHWIANHNNFVFNCSTLADLWSLDAWIPLKDCLLIELIRAATIWTVWLTRNKVCFSNIGIPSLSTIGSQIISLTTFWCKSNLDNSFLKLTLVLPMDVENLSQAGNFIILSETDTSEEASSTWNSEEDPCLGLEGSDLSDYLQDRAIIDAIDAVYLMSPDPSSQFSSSLDSIIDTSGPST